MNHFLLFPSVAAIKDAVSSKLSPVSTFNTSFTQQATDLNTACFRGIPAERLHALKKKNGCRGLHGNECSGDITALVSGCKLLFYCIICSVLFLSHVVGRISLKG